MAPTRDDGTLSRVVLLALALLVALPLLMMAVVAPVMGLFAMGHTGAGVPRVVVLLATAVPLAVVVLLVVYGLRALTGGTDPALEELRTAYARGDIDEEEFERRRERLTRDG